MATDCRFLTWESAWAEEPPAAVHGLLKVDRSERIHIFFFRFFPSQVIAEC